MSSALVAAVSLLAAQGYHPKGPKIEVELTGHRTFIISTDTKGSPKTVKGILKLVREGFYDGQRFHRVEDWVVQWGDPQSRTLPMGDSRLGTQGSGHPLTFEAPGASFLRGVVGIASTGSGVGGDSQLFVLTKDESRLDGHYAVLGKVTSGMKVVDSIQIGDKIERMWVVGGRR